jgi:carbon monoxide dehydrogenase subunit G
MKFEEAFTVPQPPERVFAFFEDVERVAGCVPGVEQVEIVGEKLSRIRVTQKVGSLSATFDLKMELAERRSNEYLEFSTIGRTVKGAAGVVRATNRVFFEPADGGGTSVRLASDVALGGMLGSMGHAVVNSKVREVSDAFATALRSELERWTEGHGSAA